MVLVMKSFILEMILDHLLATEKAGMKIRASNLFYN